MDLIERYLAAVGRSLPSKQAPDIKAELRDLLLSRVEEQEAERGRPLDRAELEALLIDFGHPLEVAARYRKAQHLIGPEVYPFWWASVKMMLAIVAGAYLVLIILGEIEQKTPAEFNRAVPSVWYVAVYLFGIITLAFMGFERFGKTAFLRRWKPRNLPPATGKTRSRFEVAAEVTMDVVFLLWWLGAIHFRDFVTWPATLTVELAPVWTAWKWPIVGYAAMEIAVNLLVIVQPGALRFNALASIVRYAVGVVIFSQIFQAGHWLVIGGSALLEHSRPTIQANFDLGMKIGVGFTIVAFAFRIGQELWRLRLIRQAEESVAGVAARAP
ncbi:MAG: hypothetical protein ACXWKN_07700 [Phenylobacterium sp.]